MTRIIWTGSNLKEVIEFTGKHPRFDEWFSSWEDYERLVLESGSMFKLFLPEGLVHVWPGDEIIKLQDGSMTIREGIML